MARPRTSRVSVTASEFARASDVLSVGNKVSAQDIVNVLGRWRSYKDWESVGKLVEMDKLFDADGQPVPGVKFKPLSPSGIDSAGGRKVDYSEYYDENTNSMKQDPRPTPQRRGFALRRGLCQRYWHNENISLLPFTSAPLAKSVGSSVREMNKLPINELAADIVFDAIAQSQSGIIQRELCDARRVSYEKDGNFDAEQFQSDLATARFNVAKSYAIFPGIPTFIQAYLFVRLDGYHAALDYFQNTMRVLSS